MADAQDLNIVLFESRWLLRCIAALATYAIAGSAPALAEEAFAPDLCVLPIKNSTVEAARALARLGERFIDNHPASSTLAHQVTMIPGVPKPIIYPWFEANHAWTVSEDNAFEAMPGPFPGSSLYDKFVVEIVTGRVLGLGYKGVYAFDRGTGQFRLIVPTATTRPGEAVNDADFQTVRTIVHVERLGLTLIGTDHGVFQLLGDRVQPLAGAGKREVGTVMGIIDLPVHHALMLAGGNGAGAMIRHDDGSIEQLVTTGAGLFRYPDYVITARESRLPGRIVVRAAQRLLEVEMRSSPAGFSPVRVTELISERKNLTVGGLVTSAGEYLVLGRPGWWGHHGLERLEADGLHTVPGEAVEPSELNRLWETSKGEVLIEGRTRRYLYDGSRVSVLAAVTPDRIGQYVIPYDLPSIGMVVFRTQLGLFELTGPGQLESLRLPFEYGSDGFINVAMAEFPAAHVGLIATRDNLYALSTSGVVRAIRGGGVDQYSSPSAGVIPGRNVMLVLGRNSLHLVATGAACNATSGLEVPPINRQPHP